MKVIFFIFRFLFGAVAIAAFIYFNRIKNTKAP